MVQQSAAVRVKPTALHYLVGERLVLSRKEVVTIYKVHKLSISGLLFMKTAAPTKDSDADHVASKQLGPGC